MKVVAADDTRARDRLHHHQSRKRQKLSSFCCGLKPVNFTAPALDFRTNTLRFQHILGRDGKVKRAVYCAATGQARIAASGLGLHLLYGRRGRFSVTAVMSPKSLDDDVAKIIGLAKRSEDPLSDLRGSSR